MRSARRVPVTLACAECGSRNYPTTRPVKQGAKELVLKKFCAACKKHTVHRETK